MIFLISVSFLFSKNDRIKYGGEKVEKDKYVTIETPENKYDSDAKFEYWDYDSRKWIEITNSNFSKEDSIYKWKPTEKILDKRNLRIRIMDSENKILYMSPTYILKAEDSNEKPVFQTETKEDNHTFGIYPNPVKDKTINIVSKSASVEIQSLKVIDMSGLTIFEINNIEITGNYNIHLPNISRGAYIVQISTASNIETKKVIIE
jgi:hypothetical protein